MDFIDREQELARLQRLTARKQGGLAVIWGRRRVGKTRLLTEWTSLAGGLYSVADQSTPTLQRTMLAETLSQKLPGFNDVQYPTWTALLSRLAQDAERAAFRGPFVFDELPYLVEAAPELPSILQRWVDHEAKAARLTIAIAGSSQRMMQGIVLDASAPLYGRASENIKVPPLPVHAMEQVGLSDPRAATLFYACWGGIARYWELALALGPDTRRNVIDLVLDPTGPLHLEPTRLLTEEQPSAMELKPLLDAIGSGAHRASEIAGRMGRPSTSLSRPLERLTELGLVRREIPFDEPPLRSKRSLYVIDDPFLRLWFRLVSPNRSALVSGTTLSRAALLERALPGLMGAAWEDLARMAVPHLKILDGLSWTPAGRWWHGNEPEWDVVATDIDRKRLLLGEAKWSAQAFTKAEVVGLVRQFLARRPPSLESRFAEVVRVLFVPQASADVPSRIEGVFVVTGKDVFAKA